jgi:hypothetical protein
MTALVRTQRWAGRNWKTTKGKTARWPVRAVASVAARIGEGVCGWYGC